LTDTSLAQLRGDKAKELMDCACTHRTVSTHSHHLPDSAFRDFSLDILLKRSYVDWCGVGFDATQAGRRTYLDKVRHKSYFIWLQKSIMALYGIDKPLSADTWEETSRRISAAHRDKAFHLRVLKENCRYARVILDTYWEPGDDNGHPELFSPAFRVDPLFYAYSLSAKDHDGNNPSAMYGLPPDNLDDFLLWVRQLVIKKKRQGCVAIKAALAYDRGLAFHVVPKAKAAKAFTPGADAVTKEDIVNFQDYLFHYICALSAEFSLPLQCHTGLGQLTQTGALALKESIEANPQTKFVLFHCSYPWTQDISALLHNYPNVYPDLCWLPILSPTAAVKTLHELLEVGTADKVCWGCDTWTSEESYGALLAFRRVLVKTLEEKVSDGYFSMADARQVIDNIMENNAMGLYGLRG